MIPSGHRLPARAVKKILNRGSRFGGTTLSLKFLKTDFPSSRATVIVSKKIAKSAVKRNLAKRRIKSVLQETFKLVQSYDLVIFVKTVSDQTDYRADIERWLKNLSSAR